MQKGNTPMTSYLSNLSQKIARQYSNYSSYQLSNLVDILEYRATYQPDKIAYRFLDNGETEGKTLTYQQLAQKAQAIASNLKSLNAQGQRALLLYLPGLDFISAFFGCLYAGVIAVPVYPPRRNQSLQRLEVIIQDSQAAIALTTSAIIKDINTESSLITIATDTLADATAAWQIDIIDPQSIAFLQYTSGSTGVPKGVMVTHNNILHNCEQIYRGFGHHSDSQGVIWLPVYHDMGLIGGVIQPLYGGFPVNLMSPVDFLQKPLRWLEAISRYKSTTSGGPNFAYDLCLRKVTPEQLENLDLSSWEVAFTGAEPVRAETLAAFSTKFAPCGFRREAFYPCYGMAEATLFISGGTKNREPVIEKIDELALSEDRAVVTEDESAKTVVGCGYAWNDQKILIVNPETLTVCSPREVGEIWVQGASVTKGYWQQEERTKEVFDAYTKDTGEGPFLRTGDLGYLRGDGELFITGRIKDVIIIRGRNHYPQDIECTVEMAHKALVPHRSAAFSVEVNGEEKLIIAVEVERRFRERRRGENHEECRIKNSDPGFEIQLQEQPIFTEIVNNIRQAVVKNQGLQVHKVLLLRIGTIPKTSSGKIQRFACRKGFLENSLNLVHAS
jgi:acyl-CoA synthetase (AMP-forming)/AMP-acid ligase II